MYATMRTMPMNSVFCTGASFVSYSLKIIAPAVTATATRYSNGLYVRCDTR